MNHADPPLYDLPRALGEMDRYRASATSDPVAAQSIKISADLARHIARHFPDESDRRTAGCALILAAASLGVLQGIPIEVVCNVAGLAGHELYRGAP
jgi:hypothetical protein